jgi:aldose 1-epimerase
VTLILRAGDWEAELRPETGGSLSALRKGGVEVLRTMPEGSASPLDAACFPLVPYCNRIADGRFTWQGREVRLPQNFAPETSSLHGFGWESAWDVASLADFKCAMDHRHDHGAWPWAYEAQQRVRLGARGLALSMDVTNRSNEVMPCGLGFHPYFRRRPETRVRFASGGMVEVDDALLPTGEISPPGRFANWQGGARLPSTLVDHCFTGWDGTATIEDDLGTITLTARGASCLHLYAPADGSALCLEPVSHTPDALNRDAAAMTAVPPGCSATMTMWISAD